MRLLLLIAVAVAGAACAPVAAATPPAAGHASVAAVSGEEVTFEWRGLI